MSFKSFAGARDRRALLEEWRRKNARKASNKSEASVSRDDVGGAREVDAASASRGSAHVTPAKTPRGPATMGVKYDCAGMRGKDSGASKGDECEENNDSFVTPRSKTRGARVESNVGGREPGEQVSTSAKSTPGSGRGARPGSFFSLSGAPKAPGSAHKMMTIDAMPSPAVRARLKAVEIEKEALQALASKLRESSEIALEAAHSGRTEAEERAKTMSQRLQKLESDRSTLVSDMAAVRAQAQALLKAKEEHARALRKEKRAAEAAVKALEQVKEDAAAAVQEREFTIANQAAILQELDDELDRAERSREKAELYAAEKDKHVAQLKSKLDEAKRELELATKNQSLKRDIDSNGVRASHEKLLQLAGARQEAEAEAARARQEVKSLEIEVEARRVELENVQSELEKCLQEERAERQRAEDAFSEVQIERNTLELLVEKRTLEKIALEERLETVSAEAEVLRSEMNERDALLRDGTQLLEAKECELDTAVTYVLQLQDKLAEMQASGEGEDADVSEQMKELQKKYEALNAEKKQILEVMQKEIQGRDAQLSASKRSLDSKEAELNELRVEYDAKTMELDPLELELQGLREKVYALKFELDEKTGELIANDALVKQLMSAEKRQNANVKRLEFGLAQRDEKLRNFTEELNNLKMESEMKDEDISERLNNLREREDALKELQRTAELKLEALREENAHVVEKLDGEVNNAKARCAELEQELELLRGESTAKNSEKIQALEEKFAESCAELEASQNEVTRLYALITELEAKAEESMSSLTAELELTKAELIDVRKEANEVRATADEVEADSIALMKEMQQAAEDMEKKINEYKELVKLRESELKNLKGHMRSKSNETERLKESARTHVTVVEKLKTALNAKVAECERMKSEIVKAQKELAMFQQEIASSKKVQKDLQQAMNEVQLRFEKSEEQRDMLAGSLAKQEEYHESANKAREEMHQIQLEDAADELRSMRRKSTALATALQQNVRMNELDAEVALLVEEFAETMQMTPQTALPTPTMTLNEPKTKPKTYRKTPAKPKANHQSFITPVRPDATLKENIHKLNERADQISFNELASNQTGLDSNVYATPGDENNGTHQTLMSGKKPLAPHSAKKTRPALGDISQNLAM